MAKDLTPLSQRDFEAIEAAVMETDRGRWFLSEYARRNRNADTTLLLDAIAKLERSIPKAASPGAPAAGPPHEFRINLVEMIAAIAETRRQIASMRPQEGDDSRFCVAADELDAIVSATEQATQRILEAAEQVQECAWSMREAGANDAYCEKFDTLVTRIYTACTFHDLTGQRISKVVALLGYLEERLDAMSRIWGGEIAPSETAALQDRKRHDTEPDAHLLNGPQHPAYDTSRDDIDLIMVDIDDFAYDGIVSESEPGPAVAETAEQSAPDTPVADDDDDLFAEPPGAEGEAATAAAPPDDDPEEILFTEADIIEDIVDDGAAGADAAGTDGDLFEDAAPPHCTAEAATGPDAGATSDAASGPEYAEAASAAGDDDLADSDLDTLDQDEKLALFS
jgi:chemotaxis regulatin CheY-phosphate phosphatase CheZ